MVNSRKLSFNKYVFGSLRDISPNTTIQSPNKIFQPAIIDIDAGLNTILQKLDLKIRSTIKPMFIRIMLIQQLLLFNQNEL